MLSKAILALAILSASALTFGAEAVDSEELQRQINLLNDRLEQLQSQLDLQSASDANQVQSTTEVSNTIETHVDLTDSQTSSFEDFEELTVFNNPWWRNIDISGFAAVGYYDTGSAGTRDNGGFEIKEASLFINAAVWEDVDFFVEFVTNRLGRDGEQFTRTGEVYIQIHDINISQDLTMGLKIGRIDVPFGEEYLWQDAIDNPLITNSVNWPYTYDEGIAITGDLNGIGWVFSVTDGLIFRSREENSDKALNLKLFTRPIEPLYLSISAMSNGDSSASGMTFAGSLFTPVGGFGHQSTLGVSPSKEISSDLYQVDARLDISLFDIDSYISLSIGTAEVDDDVSEFDRDFHWLTVEPYLQLNQNWYTLLRYSEIGTYDRHEGYRFDGKTFAGGSKAFGFDTRRLRRLALGLGWTPNPNVRAKLEVAKDWFDLIDQSLLSTNNSDRLFAGFELAVGF